MTKLQLLILAGALVSVGFYIAVFLLLVIMYSLNYWLGLTATVTAVTYYARKEIMKRLVEEATSD